MIRFAMDVPVRVARRFRNDRPDYRSFLFEDLQQRLDGIKPKRILEIGPRDGHDTKRLVTLGAEKLILVDLPDKQEAINSWLPDLADAPVELIYGNIMYDRRFDAIDPFDIVWCTGVLYHNPEQLRFIRQLFDLTAPGGLLVLETATARRPKTRNENCVEIWYPPDKAKSRPYHVSINVTHLPSEKAVWSWLEMAGFCEIAKSQCHRRITRSLASTRVAFIARRSIETVPSIYYSHVGHEFPIGRGR